MIMRLLHRWDRKGYLFAVASVAVATLLFVAGRELFAKGQWALLYLLIIVFIASVAGVRASMLAAVLAFFTWNFFLLPPYNTLLIHDSKDWLSLIVFLLVGMMMGLQTGRMRAREADALAREHETALLNRLSASLVSITSTGEMAQLLLQEVKSYTDATTVFLYLPAEGGTLTPLGLDGQDMPSHEEQQTAVWVYTHKKAIGLLQPPVPATRGDEGWPEVAKPEEIPFTTSRHGFVIPVQSTSCLEAVLSVGERRNGQRYTAYDARLLVASANLVAGFLERQRLEAAASRIEALRESERLKSTLISSVSHELKTPLAAVTATITSLLEDDVEWDAGSVRNELEAVSTDLARFNDSINALLDLSRLKADAWSAKRDQYDFGEILGAVMNKLSEQERQRIALSVPEDLPPVCVDFQQWAQALHHLLENAFTYAPAGSTVRVGASDVSGEMQMWVEDEGPGIPLAEHERVFEEFFRGASAAKAPSGTGLGLAITAEIVRASGGRIWIEDVQPHGSRFVIAMPRSARKEESA